MEPLKPLKIPRPDTELPRADRPVVRPTVERVKSDRDEAARRRSVKFDNIALMNMGEGMYTVDADGLVTSMNPTAEILFGRTFEELAGRKMHDMTHYKHRDGSPFPSAECSMFQVLDTGKSIRNADDSFIRKDGTFFDVVYSSSPIREDGEIKGLVVVFRDVTERNQTLAALRESEERFHNLANNISQLAWMTDADGWIFWYNQRWYDYTGTTLDEMQGWGWQAVHHPVHVERVTAYFKKFIDSGEEWEDTFPLRSKTGEYRWFLSRAQPIRDSDGKIVRWFGTNTDITEQRQARLNAEFLAAISEDLNQIADTHEMIRSVTTKIGTFMDLSACALVHIDETENTASVTHNWHRPDVPGLIGNYSLSDYLANEFQKALRAGESFVVRDTAGEPRSDAESFAELKIGSFVVVPAIKSGQWRFSFAVYHSSPHDWGKDEIELARQLTDRIWARLDRDRAEDAVRESEARFSLAQEAGNVGVWDWDVAVGRTYWSETMWRLYDAKPQNINPDEGFWLSHIHGDDRDRAKLSIQERLASTHDRHTDTFRVVQKNGGVRWIESSATIQRDVSGKPVRMYGVDIDITDKKNVEERIRRSENQLRIITNSVPGLISYIDKEHRYRFVNHQYTEWFGKPESEILGRHMRDLFGSKGYKTLKPKVEQVLAGEAYSIETTVDYPKAGKRFVQFSYTPDFADDGEVRGFYVLVTDLTDRKQAEDRLRTSEERMRVLMWSLTEHAIISITIDGRIDAWNRGAQLIFGYKPDEIMGSPVERLFTPEDIENGVHLKEMRLSRQKGHAADDRWHMRKNGTRFFASGEMTPVLLGKSLIGYAKIVRDLTNAKLIADELKHAHDEMEIRVADRTKELAEANALLLKQMEERALAEDQRLGLLRRLFTVQEDERGRIARDMHDQLGQRLTALRLKIASLRDLCAHDPVVSVSVNRLQEIAEHLDNEVSFMAWEMRPSILDAIEFANALENYVKEWSRHTDIFAEFDAIGVRDVKFDADLENNLYRITQEALNNAAKHAKANRINVVLKKREDQLILIIEDNGVGFDIDAMAGDRPGEKGFGLFGMRDRAALVSGTLEIESSKNKGTSIYVRVPLL